MSTTIIYSTSKEASIKNSEDDSSKSSSPKNSNENSSKTSPPKNSDEGSSKASSSNNSEDSSKKDTSCKSQNNNSKNSNSDSNANHMSLSDKDIALDLLTSSKATVTTLAKVLTESTNSQVREMLRNQLTLCINSHYRLSDIAVNKGWYNAYVEPCDQLQQDISTIKNLT